jgi:predicted nucleic acid-binding protein
VFLLDTSVINRLDVSSVAEALVSLASQGKLFTTAITKLEMMAGNRTPKWDRLPTVVSLEAGDDHVAIALWTELHKSNKQRGRKPGDLLIAAIALRTGFTVIHYDHDYDTIASLKSAKRLKTAWVVAAASIS